MSTVIPFRPRAEVPRGMSVLQNVPRTTWAVSPVYFSAGLTLERIALALNAGGMHLGYDGRTGRVLVYETTAPAAPPEWSPTAQHERSSPLCRALTTAHPGVRFNRVRIENQPGRTPVALFNVSGSRASLLQHRLIDPAWVDGMRGSTVGCKTAGVGEVWMIQRTGDNYRLQDLELADGWARIEALDDDIKRTLQPGNG